MPKFSIVIPCFNAADTIVETLASIHAQTFCDWEVICLDDGSTDSTAHLLRLSALRDRRVRYVRNMRKGPSAARNQGALVHARGDFVAFCDADDLWEPTKLEELEHVFADSRIDGAFGQVGFFEGTIADVSATSTLPEDDLNIEALLGENPVCTMSNITLRRSAFVASGGFNEDMVHNEDLEWLIRLVGDGANIVPVPSLQTWYRNSSSGLSTNHAAMLEGRTRALRTAKAYGFAPSAQSNAVHFRHLARRALRSGEGRFDAVRFAAAGLRQSPTGFLMPLRRGGLTLVGSACAAVLPRSVSTYLFS